MCAVKKSDTLSLRRMFNKELILLIGSHFKKSLAHNEVSKLIVTVREAHAS